jgi:sortase A
MALMDKKRHGGRRARRRTYKQRSRTGLYIFVGLVVTALGLLAYLGLGSALSGGSGPVERVQAPAVEGPPAAVSERLADEARAKEGAAEEEAARERAAEERAAAEERREAEAPVAPDDPTMYLSVPKLGISDALVVDGEAGLEMGAMHLPGTGFPWQPGSNTYIAGHRVGFPGTGSDRIFFDLPLLSAGDEVTLTDANGETYTYAVSEMFAVTPFDTWVTGPTGADTVTLQVCTETPDDWFTIGPGLMSSGPESGRLIVRATRV